MDKQNKENTESQEHLSIKSSGLLYCSDIEKLLSAISLYGMNWHDAMLECQESHINGDCVLCGAI